MATTALKSCNKNKHTLLTKINDISRSQPGSVALLTPGFEPLSYHQLYNQILYLGGALRGLGIGRTDRVAVLLPNGPHMAAAFLGVSAFACCVPLDPAQPVAELEVLLNETGAAALLMDSGDQDASSVSAIAEKLDLPVVNLAISAGIPELKLADPGAEPAMPDDVGSEDDPALLLHTSGTTARPKPIVLSHRNLLCSAQQIASSLALSPSDRCINVMPLFHIHGLAGALLASLHSGGSVVCTTGFHPVHFARLLRETGPTWYTAVPTIHRQVLALVEQEPDLASNAGLRFIRSSSSPLPQPLLAALETAFEIPVIEAYGMTEAAHQIASNPLPPLASKPGSVGQPTGTQVVVLDEHGEHLPVNQIGEIAISGANISDGELSAEYKPRGYRDGWFFTGDRGWIDSDGYIFLTDRSKDIVKRGGTNISPLEVDAALDAHPDVVEAASFAAPHPTLGEDLHAAVVLRTGASTSEKELRYFLGGQLPLAHIPSQILPVTEIPKGSTGKLQRRILYDAFADRPGKSDDKTRRSPSGDLELQVAAVFKQVLETSSISAEDNFFSIGGDSLSATRVLAQLSSEYGIELAAVSLFFNPTIADLSVEITRQMSEDENSLEELLNEIEALSDDEAQRLLNESPAPLQ